MTASSDGQPPPGQSAPSAGPTRTGSPRHLGCPRQWIKTTIAPAGNPRENSDDAEFPYGGAEARAAFGSHRVARPRLSSAAGTSGWPAPPTAAAPAVAPLNLKNETAIWNRRLAPRARVRVTEMVDAAPTAARRRGRPRRPPRSSAAIEPAAGTSGGQRRQPRRAGVAPLKLKNETAIWNWRLAPRARVRVTEMVDAEQFLSAHSSVTQSGGAGARAASRSLGVARPSPIYKK